MFSLSFGFFCFSVSGFNLCFVYNGFNLFYCRCLAWTLRLKEHLRQRLIECGWKEDLKALCKGRKEQIFNGFASYRFSHNGIEIISKKGIESLSVDDLVHEISPKARSMLPKSAWRRMNLLVYLFKMHVALVPDSIRNELLGKIKAFLKDQEA